MAETTLSQVKRALRISHNLLDADIEGAIQEAKDELARSGVDPKVIAENGSLIQRAVITYCQVIFGNDKTMVEGYQRSFEYQQDNLRKTYPATGE